MPYQPSHKTIDKLLISFGIECQNELALPGNWSPNLFVKDLFDFPVETKEKLVQTFFLALTSGWTYRKWYQESRGHSRDIQNPEVWDLFDLGQLMLLGESLFLRLIQSSETKEGSLSSLISLSQKPICQWSSSDFDIFDTNSFPGLGQ